MGSKKRKKAPERPRDPLLVELDVLVQDALAGNEGLKESAQHRYAAAVKSLMLVRKMESTKRPGKPKANAGSKPSKNGAANRT